jgi:hypothetical protein
VAFDQSGPRWLGISDLIAEPEGPTFISYKVARSRLDRLRFVTQDPEQKSAVVGFGRNGIQVITGRPWRSTTDKRRFAWGNCRPSPGAGHGVLRAAPAGARAADHQGPFRPLTTKAPASRQWRPNRRIFEDAASDRASNLRSAAQVCTAIRSTVVLSLAARPLADHFSPSRWSAREGVVPRR